MSERGVFGLDRGVFDHEIFPDVEFTEREAWIWLIAEASWKKRTRRVGDYTANLERGQLIGSVRFLAEKWGWSKSRVERFLNKLKTETMIGTDSGAGITIITICNYAKYQKVSLPDGTDDDENSGQMRDSCGTDAGQMRDNTEDNKYIKNIEGREEGASAPNAKKASRKKPARAMPDIFPMSQAMRDYAERRGFKFEIPPSFTNFKARPGPAQEMFEAFKNHHAAKGSVFADWEAAWRTWVDNQVKFEAQRKPSRSAL